jgi:hypothetical protein
MLQSIGITIKQVVKVDCKVREQLVAILAFNLFHTCFPFIRLRNHTSLK